MGLGSSLILMAVGAILKWAVSVSVSGVNLQTIGLILLIIGAIGFVISLFWMASVANRRTRADPQAPVVTEREYRDPAAGSGL